MIVMGKDPDGQAPGPGPPGAVTAASLPVAAAAVRLFFELVSQPFLAAGASPPQKAGCSLQSSSCSDSSFRLARVSPAPASCSDKGLPLIVSHTDVAVARRLIYSPISSIRVSIRFSQMISFLQLHERVRISLSFRHYAGRFAATLDHHVPILPSSICHFCWLCETSLLTWSAADVVMHFFGSFDDWVRLKPFKLEPSP